MFSVKVFKSGFHRTIQNPVGIVETPALVNVNSLSFRKRGFVSYGKTRAEDKHVSIVHRRIKYLEIRRQGLIVKAGMIFFLRKP